MMLNCDICGCIGFKNPGALASHKATSRACKLAKIQKNNAQPPVERAGTSAVNSQRAADYISLVDALTDFTAEGQPGEDVLCTPMSSFCEAGQPSHRFDSTLHLVAFIRQCRNTLGLSMKDSRRLLSLLFHPDFSLENVDVRNVSDLLKYEKRVASEHGTGWKQAIIREKGEHISELLLHYQDPVEVLSTLFSNPKNGEEFKMAPSQPDSDVSYSSPDTGEWWKKMQVEIEKNCPGGVIAGVILYSDQTTLSHNQKVTGYPLMMSLANINCMGRREEAGNALLAILPTYGLSDIDVMKSKNATRLKISLIHTCLKIILAPLKALSYTGLPLEDPFGSQRWVFPLLYADIGDHPEMCKMTCTYDTNKCNFPCSVCLCPKGQLHAVTVRHDYRTEVQMQSIYKEIISAPTMVAEDIAKEHSVHPVECALWGFFGEKLALGDPYRAVHPDKMHQFELGLFKTFIGILRVMANETPRVTFTSKALEVMDQRLTQISDSHRYPEFRIPACRGRTGYFTSNATFQAFEHRSILQVIIPVLLGLYPTPVVQVAISMWNWYSCAFRTPEHTDESLKQMDKLMADMVKILIVVLGKYQKSNFDIIKVHVMSHLSDSIRRSGIPSEYSTNLYEHLHIRLMKVPYRGTNKKHFAQQMTKHHLRLLAIGRASTESPDELDAPEERETALDKAVKSGRNVMMGSKIQFRMDWLQREAEDLPPRATQFLQGQPEVARDLKRVLESYCTENDLQKDVKVLDIKNGIAIPAGVGTRFGDWPMIARATASFHGGPYFTDIAIQMEDSGEDPQTAYGQIRLLFSCVLRSVIAELGVSRDLALIRLYDKKARPERITGCEVLSRIEERSDVGSSSSYSSSRQRRREPYLIIPVASILKVVQLIPHYGGDEEKEFLVNTFKF